MAATSDSANLTGIFQLSPLFGNPSGIPSVQIPLTEVQQLGNFTPSAYDLTTDSPVSVAFGGVVNASLVIVKAIGGKVRVRITSADGSSQSVPVDSLLVLFNYATPITALDLTRTPGVEINVSVFLGEHA